MTYFFEIPFTLPGLNDYIAAERANRIKAANIKRDTEDMIIVCIIKHMRGVKLDKPVHVTYSWIEKNKRRDKDNIAFAKKFIQDALVKAGTLKNDGWNEIVGFTDVFTVDKVKPRVEVRLEEIE